MVLDDRDLVVGDVAPPVAPEHRVLVERVHVGVPSPSEDRSECCYALTTYVPAILSCQPCFWPSNAAQMTPMKRHRMETKSPM